MEKVVDKEELMEWIRAGPVIHVRSSKDFKIVWKKKNIRKEISSSQEIDIVSTQTIKYNTIRIKFMKQVRST